MDHALFATDVLQVPLQTILVVAARILMKAIAPLVIVMRTNADITCNMTVSAQHSKGGALNRKVSLLCIYCMNLIIRATYLGTKAKAANKQVSEGQLRFPDQHPA